MPSFDVVSEIDMHEVTNAVDQTNREIGNRFDFKGTDSRVELGKDEITLLTQGEFQLQQMLPILHTRLAKRGLDIRSLDEGEPQLNLSQAKQVIKLRQGIDAELGKKIVKLVKDSKLKVQAAIQGDKLRITGKSRDDLQQAIALLRGAELAQPLQFNNFRD